MHARFASHLLGNQKNSGLPPGVNRTPKARVTNSSVAQQNKTRVSQDAPKHSESFTKLNTNTVRHRAQTTAATAFPTLFKDSADHPADSTWAMALFLQENKAIADKLPTVIRALNEEKTKILDVRAQRREVIAKLNNLANALNKFPKGENLETLKNRASEKFKQDIWDIGNALFDLDEAVSAQTKVKEPRPLLFEIGMVTIAIALLVLAMTLAYLIPYLLGARERLCLISTVMACAGSLCIGAPIIYFAAKSRVKDETYSQHNNDLSNLCDDVFDKENSILALTTGIREIIESDQQRKKTEEGSSIG